MGQGTASGQDGPVHGLGPDTPCALEGCSFKTDGRDHAPRCDQRFKKRPVFPIKFADLATQSVVDLDTQFQTVIGGKPELSNGDAQTVIGLIPTTAPSLFLHDIKDAPLYVSRREFDVFRKRRNNKY